MSYHILSSAGESQQERMKQRSPDGCFAPQSPATAESFSCCLPQATPHMANVVVQREVKWWPPSKHVVARLILVGLKSVPPPAHMNRGHFSLFFSTQQAQMKVVPTLLTPIRAYPTTAISFGHLSPSVTTVSSETDDYQERGFLGI